VSWLFGNRRSVEGKAPHTERGEGERDERESTDTNKHDEGRELARRDHRGVEG
jgi:hypothetical protein